MSVSVRAFGDAPIIGTVPLPGATIHVSREATPSTPERLIMSVEADSGGTAVMAIAPGRYIVTAGANGYQPATSLVHVVGGDVLLLFELDLADPDGLVHGTNDTRPKGIVSGRVLSEAGDPVGDAIVELRDEESLGASAITRIDGSFRVDIPLVSPRTFAIKVSPLGSPKLSTADVTYVPDPVQPSFRVAVSPSHKTSDVEIRVPVHPEFTIRATVSDGSGRVPPETKVTASGADRTTIFLVRPDGTAISGPVPAGTYKIDASIKGTTGRLVATTTVEILDQPPPHVFLDLLLEAVPRASVFGRVEFAGLSRPLHSSSPLRVLSHRSRGAYTEEDPNGVVEADGAFRLDGLVGDHCFQLTGIPVGWRLESVMHGDRDITTVPQHFESGDQLSYIVLLVVQGNSFPQRGEVPPTCPLE